MKKIYILAVASLLSYSSLEAQYIKDNGAHHGGRMVTGELNKKIPTPHTTRAIQSFYVDYDYADEVRQNNEMGISTWVRYIWDMNMRYPDTATNSLRYGMVDFYNGTLNQINDSYGLTDGSLYPLDVAYTGVLTIDSIFIACGHQNTSGTNDTLIIDVIQLNTSGYPTTTPTVLYSESIINNASFTGLSGWLAGGGLIAEELAYNVPANTRFGIRFRYFGATEDTFGVLAGFGDAGNPCSSVPTLPFFGVKSLYYPNSYRDDIYFEGLGYYLLPTSGGGDTYYDCDGSGGYLSGVDSENPLQNWSVWIKVTADVGTIGIDNQTSIITNVQQNVPNPFNTNTTINYSLAANAPVTFTVTDLSGKLVMSDNMGDMAAGRHTINLSANQLESGVYYYTITAGASSTTKKMVVAK